MRTHDLKTWPEPFAAILSGVKRYEIRKDDRGFAVGDKLRLREWDPTPQGFGYRNVGYSDRVITARITYKTPGGSWGLPTDLCVLSIEVLP